jgi:two-component system chemotaxis response regulator CheY
VNGLDHLRVLVVEHDLWTRTHLAATLRELGVQVAQASNGMTALRSAQAEPAHVMFVGAALPELSAPELMHAVRSDPRTRHTAFVGIQELADADASLAPPCAPLSVLSTVVEALEVRRQAVVATPIRSVIASPRGTWPLVEGDSARSSSRIRNGGRSANSRLSSGIDTL